ncbi:putative membrane protein [Waddlia chondrophila 2032/99]|uniref:Putative membrane protein n=2 Tax=Waddlia chondrophila TaxID=71667 RepID=D6YWT5_WADCW|nr:hypothetical protein [Waddlia chondrophila]ADI38596.1 putative membrane protein [Waddlia chondrophila WSU 86-1044]CCB91701.1 putative membrane protein [Waddlia chondrophila 2032/99]
MTFEQIQSIFNRALFNTFHKAKLILCYFVLAMCGVLVVFFKGVSMQAGQWLAQSLTFLPIFLCAGVLFSLGILLIRIYHDEVKGKRISYRKTLWRSWEVVVGSSYVSIPIILCYLLVWMFLGIFALLSEIPSVGPFFHAVLAFAPFLLNLSCLVLILFHLALLFYVAPILALKGFNRLHISKTLMERFRQDVFANGLMLLIAMLPLLLLLTILSLAAWMTGSLCVGCSSVTETVLLWFFIMIPFTAILAPAVVFFFNFSAESHVLIMKRVRDSHPHKS